MEPSYEIFCLFHGFTIAGVGKTAPKKYAFKTGEKISKNVFFTCTVRMAMYVYLVPDLSNLTCRSK